MTHPIERGDLVVFQSAYDKADLPLYIVRDTLELTGSEYSVGIQPISAVREKDWLDVDVKWYNPSDLQHASIEQLLHHAGDRARFGLRTAIIESFRKI